MRSPLRMTALTLAIFWFAVGVAAQSNCPSNIDFELGNLSSWNCFTSINTGTGQYVWAATAPLNNRHTVTGGSAVDPHGGFPIVPPGGGTHAVRLGNPGTGREMDQIRYTFTVPANVNNYALIYRYAMVMEDPNHNVLEQPFFRVRVYNAATQQTVNCGEFNYVASSNLPGFIETGPNTDIWYRNWSTGSLDLTGQAGNTLVVEFTASDCSQSGHFGYGYVDMSCGLFTILNSACTGSVSTPLSAPPGFQTYTWYNHDYSQNVGTGPAINVPTPPGTALYHVVLTPYPGYGCGDTLSSQVTASTLNMSAGSDTTLCSSSSMQLTPTVSGTAPPFAYSWSPAAGLSCSNCANPVVSPTTNSQYVLSVSDANGCTKKDTIRVNAPVSITASQQNVKCFGQPDGSISVSAVNGTAPYSFAWNTTPVQTTANLSQVGAGSYTVQVTDAQGCTASRQIVLTQPATGMVATTAVTSNTCHGGTGGAAVVSAAGGTLPYTYSWNTNPAQTTAAVTGLAGGVYIATVRDGQGCADTASVSIAQSPEIFGLTDIRKIPCFGGADGRLAVDVSGGTAPLTYQWTHSPAERTDSLSALTAGSYALLVTDANGCTRTFPVELPEHPRVQLETIGDQEICPGENLRLGATGAASYTWYPFHLLSCQNCQNPVTTTAADMRYTVVGWDANQCSDTAAVDITILRRSPVSAGPAIDICAGDSARLSAAGGTTYRWYPAGELSDATAAAPTAHPANPGTTRYMVVVQENKCFQDTVYQSVKVWPLPSVRLDDDFRALPGAVIGLNGAFRDATGIRWSPATGLSCDDCFHPTAAFENDITYTATVSNEIGCSAQDDISIRVACNDAAFYMANTFTPNGDGQNDWFYPQGKGVNTVRRFSVYNRWGETVFSAVNVPVNMPEAGWNGMFRDQQLSPDVFMYVAEAVCADGNTVLIKGDIAIIR